MTENVTFSSATKCEICEEGQRATTPTRFKLGWIQGVLIPCLLNIWGVMLFLRISWVVAQAGILLSLLIIAISAVVCVITTLSMSAICTNGLIKDGGVYYLISRSLGPEFGASVGIIFAFANAVAASMNTIGFCDSLIDLLHSRGLKIIDGDETDIRIVGTVALLVMCIICAIGMDWESLTQNFLIVIIIAAMASFVIGTFIGPTENTAIAQGFVGLSAYTFTANLRPDFRYSEGVNHNFFSVFAIFFPSVTGIQAGANICGDLRDPATAIPKGTLLSLLISMLSYAMMVVMSGAGALRQASGIVADIDKANSYRNLSACVNTTKGCPYGLHNNYSVMQLMSCWGLLIYAGCWAATLSTALTNLLSVPRLIQALGIDRIYPGLIFFSKPYGKHGEPYRGYVLTFCVSLLFLLIADLNTIAPLITNFYLASYALINFCTFHAGFIKPLGWRPSFEYYNIWLSLLGFVLCVVIMLLLSFVMTIATAAIFFTLYLVVHYRRPDVNWGSSAQAQTYKTALSKTYDLYLTGEHAKNYCPQLLVLCGRPLLRPALVDLAHLITVENSLMIVGIISTMRISHRNKLTKLCSCNEWLRNRKIRAFCAEVNGFSFEEGARALMQACGVGRLCPNIVLLGYKGDWTTCSETDLMSYFNILHYAFESQLALAVLRVPSGLDLISNRGDDVSVGGTEAATGSRDSMSVNPILHVESDLDIINSQQNKVEEDKKSVATSTAHSTNISEGLQRSASAIYEMRIKEMNLFQRNQNAGTLDVWWLYDDGGLTILLPHIIAERPTFSEVQMRIFALSKENIDMKETKEQNLVNLLTKFRIQYQSLTVIEVKQEEPRPETKLFFDRVTEKFRSGNAGEQCRIEQKELDTLKEKTNRQLRLRELLLDHSKNARLIVMSLPMPRKDAVSAPLYMAWLETLSCDLPPMLLVRGNHTSVLSHYA